MQERERGERKTAILALGTFDGVHRGHRALLERTRALSVRQGIESVAYTFSNHPRSIFGVAPDMLQTCEERRRALEGLGLSAVHMRPFDKAFAFLEPEEFLHTLNADYDLRGVVAGFNYTFGKNGLGTEKTLRALGEKLGFSVDIVPPVLYKGETVSSSRIRDCILGGAMDDAREMLAEPYSLTGTVVKHKGIGVTMGFPTANLLPPAQKVLPHMGVYAAAARIGDEIYPAVTNVGDNPTVSGKQVTIETHLLDTNRDLYGKEMTVFFYSFLRGEMRFSGKDALAQQIAKDVVYAKRIINDLL